LIAITSPSALTDGTKVEFEDAIIESVGDARNNEVDPNLIAGVGAIAAALPAGDARVNSMLAALRAAIGKTTDPSQLADLAQAYVAAAGKARLDAPPLQDIAVLIGRIPDLRTAEQSRAFVAAISAAARLGSPPLSWKQVGLITTAALLQPVSAGKPTRDLVGNYEKFLRDHPEGVPAPLPAWSGDVWAFAIWARDNLPGFDPHRPRVDFLPAVAN